MKRRMLSLFLVILILFSLCGVVSIVGIALQAQPTWQDETMDGVHVAASSSVQPHLVIGGPTSALVGQTFELDGILEITNGGTGIPNQNITVQRSNDSIAWSTLATGATNSIGQFPVVQSESAVGTYYYRTTYAGNATYTPTTSNVAQLTIIGSPTPTSTPTQLTATVNTTIITVGQPFTVSGTLTNATCGAPITGAIIQLQKNVSGAWTDVGEKTDATSATGSYSISTSESAAAVYEYRTDFARRATNVGSNSASIVVIVKPATHLTVAVNPPTITVNQTFTFYGVLTTADGAPMSGETIQLQKNVSGAWTDVGEKTDATSATGSYSISTSESAAAVYEYRANYTGNAAYAGSSSDPVVVTVNKPVERTPTQLTASASPAQVDSKQYFTISGTLTNAVNGAPIPGETVQLQKNLSGLWNDISGRESTTNLDGSYSITYNEGSYGTYEYQTRYDGSATYARSNSTSVFVTVQQPVKTPTQLTLTATPLTVKQFTSFTLNGTLTNATSGTGIQSATIQLQRSTDNGVTWNDVADKTATTDASGHYNITLSELNKGQYQYRTTFAGATIGDTDYGASTSNTAPVTVPVTPLACVVAVGAFIVIWAYVRRRR